MELRPCAISATGQGCIFATRWSSKTGCLSGFNLRKNPIHVGFYDWKHPIIAPFSRRVAAHQFHGILSTQGRQRRKIEPTAHPRPNPQHIGAGGDVDEPQGLGLRDLIEGDLQRARALLGGRETRTWPAAFHWRLDRRSVDVDVERHGEENTPRGGVIKGAERRLKARSPIVERASAAVSFAPPRRFGLSLSFSFAMISAFRVGSYFSAYSPTWIGADGGGRQETIIGLKG